MTKAVERIEKTCPVCNQVYKINPGILKHGKGTACSRKCSYILRGLKKKIERTVCHCCVCNKKILKLPSEVHARNFCSDQCKAEGYVIAYPVGHKCNDFTVISDEVKKEDNRYSQLGRCKCGETYWVRISRFNPSTKNCVTQCLVCSDRVRQQNRLDITKEYLLREYKEKGRLTSEIADELKCNKATVVNRLNEFGIEFNEPRCPTAGMVLNEELHNLSGKEIGKWQVGEKMVVSTETSKRVAYQCTCECGVEQVVNASHLMDGLSTQCRACHGKEKRGENSPHWTGCGELTGQHFGAYKTGAKSRDFEFAITIEYAWQLFLDQGRKCALTGVALDMKSRDYDRKDGCGIHVYGTASLDRIDSSLGYIEGNVQWVHKDVNKMKWHIDQKEFVEFCRLVAAPIQHRFSEPQECVTLDLDGLWHLPTLVGQKVGSWAVDAELWETYTDTRRNRTGMKKYYACTCDCGTKKRFEKSLLLSNRVNKYKCCKQCAYSRMSGNNSALFKGVGELPLTLWDRFKKGAEDRNLNFDITINEGWELFLNQKQRCRYTGLELEMSVYSRRKGACNTASIDRIDSSRGYSADNIQWVHKTVNLMKCDFTEQYFIDTCKKVAAHKGAA